MRGKCRRHTPCAVHAHTLSPSAAIRRLDSHTAACYVADWVATIGKA